MISPSPYTAVRTLPQLTHDQAVSAVSEALLREGFAVLWTMDLQKIFGNKLGISYRKSLLLGACNPPLAHAALAIDGNMGFTLPCNAVITEDEGGAVQIGVVDPRALQQMTGQAALAELLVEVHAKLVRALESIAVSV